MSTGEVAGARRSSDEPLHCQLRQLLLLQTVRHVQVRCKTAAYLPLLSLLQPLQPTRTGRHCFCFSALTVDRADDLLCRCCHSEARLFGWVDETEAQLPEDERRGLQGSQAQYVRVPLADSTLLKVHCRLCGSAAGR